MTMFTRRHEDPTNDLRCMHLLTPDKTRLRIVVSGSSGLVGSALCDFLIAAGHEVIRLVRNPLQATTPNYCHWAPLQGVQQLEKLEQVDVVVHLAGRGIGEGRWTAAEKQRIRQSRVEATELLASQLSRLPAKLPAFISASAIGYYGDCGTKNVTETTTHCSGFLAEVARDWELATQPLTDSGTRVAFARLSMVLWPKSGALAKMLPLFKWCLAGPLGGGRQFWSWISLADVIYALYKLIVQTECRGAYNFAAPQSVTNAEFTRTLAKVVGRPAILPAPKFVLHLALGEMADALLLTSCRVVPDRLMREGYEFVHPTLEICLRSLLGKG